jgi:hypothetical protein
MTDDTVTVARLERAIRTTARCMVQHDLPRLLPTLKRLEAERDRLMKEGDAIAYAKMLLVLLSQKVAAFADEESSIWQT